MASLNSAAGSMLFQELDSLGENALSTLDVGLIVEAQELLEEARRRVDAERAAVTDENHLNDLYIIGAWLRLHSNYIELWNRIIHQRFAESWSSLQDALDSIRALKRLSKVDVQRFEEQLQNLEKAYPYRIFLSIGAVASRIECSICGLDIDSLECIHRRGYLYAGEMAHGIIREFKQLDHVSLVSNPEDKRCVVEISNESEQFKLVRYIGAMIRERKLIISEFEKVEFSIRRNPNPNYRLVGRNKPCYCGSGKKFKACCINEAFLEGAHAEVHACKSVADSNH